MSGRSVPKSSHALAELEAVRRELRDTKRALELAEAKIQEKTEIMTDLLLAMGSRENCSKCDTATVWLRIRACGNAVLYNLDGTQHWPRCRGTARPVETIAVGS